MDSQQQDPECNPEEFTLDLKHELRVRGMPDMDLRCNVHEDGYLTVWIWNCSKTGFTLQVEIPEGANQKPKRVAEDIYQTFLDYIDGPEVADESEHGEG